MLDLDEYLIDEGDDLDIEVTEDLSTIKDPKVLENEKREARKRSYYRNRQKYADKRRKARQESETEE